MARSLAVQVAAITVPARLTIAFRLFDKVERADLRYIRKRSVTRRPSILTDKQSRRMMIRDQSSRCFTRDYDISINDARLTSSN